MADKKGNIIPGNPQKEPPCVTASEIRIAEDAPMAIQCLKRTNHLDAAETLGLLPYLKEK